MSQRRRCRLLGKQQQYGLQLMAAVDASLRACQRLRHRRRPPHSQRPLHRPWATSQASGGSRPEWCSRRDPQQRWGASSWWEAPWLPWFLGLGWQLSHRPQP